MFRAIVIGLNNTPKYLYVPDGAKWFNCNGRSYRVDPEAVCQVLTKGGRIKPLTEILYFEGNPVALRSPMDAKEITQEHLDERVCEAGNKPQKSFFDILFRR